ncbi:MAG: Rrf2 family transcriptional regulator [Candidatus Binatia bacterium]
MPVSTDLPSTGARRRASLAAARSSLLNVGRRVDYALRALCYLAAQDDDRVVTCTEIQARQGVPPHFLSKILRRLVAAGVLESVSGARGGFRLGRPADRISVREVFECVEGELSLVDCVERRDAFCCFASVCTQREMWRGAQRVLSDYLDGISVRQIADRAGLVSRLTGAGNASPSRS